MADWGAPTSNDQGGGDWGQNEASSASWGNEGVAMPNQTNANFDSGHDNSHDHGDKGSENGSAAGTRSDSITCRNCDQPGHVARECPEPRKMTGECYNCGQVGHNKADCPNEKVERPFTGECYYCHKEGHRGTDCPEKPPAKCRNCLEEGHLAFECTAARFIDYSNVPDMPPEAAWGLLKEASDEKEIEDFRSAIQILAKVKPQLTYRDLEVQFREKNFKIFLIGLDKEVPKSMTNVNLQGKSGCKYSLGYFFKANPERAFLVEQWPASPEDNLERLNDTGETCENPVPLCRNCNVLGHTSKACKEEKPEKAVQEITCTNCKETGHRLRDCPKERAPQGGTCRNCNQPGHKASECTEPRSAANVECRRCGEMGHFSKECQTNQDSGAGGGACRNCGEEGHMARDCEKPKNSANVTCRNCDEVGHFSKECPQPKDWSRVQCQQCGEYGHTVRRCTQAPTESQDIPTQAGEATDLNGGLGLAPVVAADGQW